MRAVVSFSSEGRWELQEPHDAVLVKLNFEFPCEGITCLEGYVSYPAGEPKVTAVIIVDKEKVEVAEVLVKQG